MKKLYEFHLYLRLPPKIAQMMFDFFNMNYALEGGSYFMPVNEDEVGSFDEAYKLRKTGEESDLIP